MPRDRCTQRTVLGWRGQEKFVEPQEEGPFYDALGASVAEFERVVSSIA